MSKVVQKRKKANSVHKKAGSKRTVRVSGRSGNKKAAAGSKSSPRNIRQRREFTGVILIALSILLG